MNLLSLISPLDIISHVTTKYVIVPKTQKISSTKHTLTSGLGKDAAEKEQNI